MWMMFVIVIKIVKMSEDNELSSEELTKILQGVDSEATFDECESTSDEDFDVLKCKLFKGIQFAGSHLQELQRAFKNPTAHLSLIFSEAGRRAAGAVGLARGPDLAPHVAPELRPLAAELGRCVLEHGRSVEAALVRHGRRIVDEQFVLNRLAASAIDAYTAAAVMSRASRAARLRLPSAAHELRLAEAWSEEAVTRMPVLLAATRDPRALRQFARLGELGGAVAAAGGQPTPNPLNL